MQRLFAFLFLSLSLFFHSWITLEQGKTTADAMGDVWRGLEVVEAATRVGSDMLVRIKIELHYICSFCVHIHLHLHCLFSHTFMGMINMTLLL